MELDVWQLPIPDWGLTCPRCRYPLRGLPSHRCPECGTDLDMEKLVEPWSRIREPRFDGTQLPIPDFGFTCNGCGRPLAGWKEFFCPECGAAADIDARIPSGKWIRIDDPLGGLAPLLSEEKIPHTLHTSSSVRDIYMGPSMTGQQLKVPREFYLDALYVLQRVRRQVEAARAGREQSEWRCAACGESSPAHFEVCWNCQHPRDG